MFRRPSDRTPSEMQAPDRVDSVLGPGITWQGQVGGTGGMRIDGAFDGEIAIRGIVVIGEQGRVTCSHLKAVTVVVSGSLKGDITAYRVEITRTGRVWGDVVATSFSTEEGAFLRGKITMEEELDLGLAEELPEEEELSGSEEVEESPED